MSNQNPYDAPVISTAVNPVSSTRKFTLKKLDPMSCGLLAGVLYAVLGLIVGAFFSVIAVIGAASAPNGAGVGILSGVAAIVIVPVMYGVGGFIAGVIGAFLYNVCANLVGGIRFDLEA